MPSQLIQQRNIEMVRLLAADLQPRYEPNFAWCNAVAAMKALPGIRGLWAMSAYNSGGYCIDLSNGGLTLTPDPNEAIPMYGYEALIPYVYFAGQNEFLFRTDESDLDIVGNEAFVLPAAQGLSIGGWFKPDNVTQNGVALMGKWDTNGVNERSYILKQLLTSAQFVITTDGSTQLSVTTGFLAAGQWSFVAGTFDPSTRRAIFLDGTWATNAVGNPATLHSGTANFEIGSNNAAPRLYYAGLASLCFLTTTFLSDTIIESLYAQTRAMFGR